MNRYANGRRDVLKGALAMPFLSVAPQLVRAANAGTKLILLGTQGGPNFKLDRGETASLVMVEGQPYLIDCGYGALRAIMQAGVDYLTVGNIFLTHLHDDHNADLPALLSHQWTQGRVTPTNIYGPFGTDTLVDAANLYNQANTEIRLIDEARTVLPSALFAGTVVTASNTVIVVHQDEFVRVTAVENTHYPEASKEHMPHRAVSYRFESADRSVVFSGDTAYSANVVQLARNADVLVCEAMQTSVLRDAFEGLLAEGKYADNPEGIWNHIVETHTPTEDAGRMAAEAGVGTLVLTHLLPGSLNELPDSAYLQGVRKHFDGEVIVGRDQLVI